MKTQIIKKPRALAIIVSGLIFGSLSLNAGANDRINIQSSTPLTFQSHSINHNIYSYPSNLQSKASLQAELVYVSQANGPAIYSYSHSGTETTVPLNVGYVDTAYNPAIYSYDSPLINGQVEMLPTEIID
ncbi:MAG: hypothetical protein Q7U98_15395 [Methylicorpusculum sp.]|uniref:hypothetical protein n=1 Tax=Methylicorpusculum sp. TaxID=2713644 RepID=UPI0027197BFA|nr:hypothetical protein [Methylicorpusculum sp.]MDO8844460.1 hypothetical protein [Methylicorpusculum sp.]MDO8940539.1 hypothetical protein [Methylicorpusculum sp.]MDO9240078.1 hypothetical protein [Methylicorpusculum sp.]MDP2204455.1 hypothetical protein [Methylicorpusculum sp.]